jgi:bifunctional non-homologous end joining protein LigD
MTAKSESASVRVSNPNKVFWPDEGYTKLDLVNFYRDVFPVLRPYVNDRIVTLERCPNGMLGDCFYQKEKPPGMPPNTPTKTISSESTGKAVHYVVGGSLATQLALANLACIPVHVCGSRAKTFPRPDWVCFDLDPESGKFADAAKACLRLKEVLDALELVSFPKTSGSRGIHVFIPIRIGPTSDEVLSFARDLARRLAASYTKELTVESAIRARGDRVYVDVLRNGSLQTVVSPYSVRRRARAPVSTPLAWSEVKPSLDPARFNLGNFRARLNKKDPWADFFQSRQTLASAIARLRAI